MQGLSWVLKYYYTGCKSWGWFYPYHYAPLASDLVHFDDFESIENFPPSEPFQPFQQLLGVLPIASKKLLPVEYQKLMTVSTSPLKSYYPIEFELDQNGKKNPWEAVVIIPFINADILRDACNQIDQSKVLEIEKKRNNLHYHSTWYYHDEKYTSTLEATLPGIPSLKDMHTQKKILQLPNFEIDFRLCDGVLMGSDAPSCFPTLTTIPFSTVLKNVNVTLFKGKSRKDTLVICIEKDPLWKTPIPPFAKQQGLGDFFSIPSELSDDDDDEDDSEEDEGFITEELVLEKEIQYEQELEIEKKNAIEITQKLAQDLIGKIVYSNWPYHDEVRVVELACSYIRVQGDKVIPFQGNWSSIQSDLLHDFITKRGIQLRPIQILVRVEPIIGMTRSSKGALIKSFDINSAYWQPYQVIVTNIKNQDHRFKERSKQTIKQMFPIGSEVIILDKKFFGSYGTIESYKSNEVCKISVSKLPKLSNFPKVLHNQFNSQVTSFSLKHIANSLHVSAKVMSQITGEIWYHHSNLGLGFKFSARNEKILGYSDRKNNRWFFSKLAFDLIKQYHSKFPEIFNALENHDDSSNNDYKFLDSVFSGDDSNKERFSELKKWLQTINLSGLRASVFNESLIPQATKIIEKKFQVFCRNSSNSVQLFSKTFPRQYLQSPISSIYLSTQNDISRVINVGDYVIYLRKSSSPAFGSLAIVVSVNRKLSCVSLLFPEEFIGGSDLGGICSSYRGLKDVELRYCLLIPTPSASQQSQQSPSGQPKNNSNGNNNDNRNNNNNNNDNNRDKDQSQQPVVTILQRKDAQQQQKQQQNSPKQQQQSKSQTSEKTTSKKSTEKKKSNASTEQPAQESKNVEKKQKQQQPVTNTKQPATVHQPVTNQNQQQQSVTTNQQQPVVTTQQQPAATQQPVVTIQQQQQQQVPFVNQQQPVVHQIPQQFYNQPAAQRQVRISVVPGGAKIDPNVLFGKVPPPSTSTQNQQKPVLQTPDMISGNYQQQQQQQQQVPSRSIPVAQNSNNMQMYPPGNAKMNFNPGQYQTSDLQLMTPEEFATEKPSQIPLGAEDFNYYNTGYNPQQMYPNQANYYGNNMQAMQYGMYPPYQMPGYPVAPPSGYPVAYPYQQVAPNQQNHQHGNPQDPSNQPK